MSAPSTAEKPTSSETKNKGNAGVDSHSNVAELAQRRVLELDKVVGKLKTNHQKALDATAADEANLADIDKELAKLHERYDPLCERLEFRLKERDRVAEQIESISKQFAAIINTTRTRIRVNGTADAQHRKKNAMVELRVNRGFSGGLGTTYDRTGKQLVRNGTEGKGTARSNSGRGNKNT